MIRFFNLNINESRRKTEQESYQSMVMSLINTRTKEGRILNDLYQQSKNPIDFFQIVAKDIFQQIKNNPNCVKITTHSANLTLIMLKYNLIMSIFYGLLNRSEQQQMLTWMKEHKNEVPTDLFNWIRYGVRLDDDIENYKKSAEFIQGSSQYGSQVDQKKEGNIDDWQMERNLDDEDLSDEYNDDSDEQLTSRLLGYEGTDDDDFVDKRKLKSNEKYYKPGLNSIEYNYTNSEELTLENENDQAPTLDSYLYKRNQPVCALEYQFPLPCVATINTDEGQSWVQLTAGGMALYVKKVTLAKKRLVLFVSETNDSTISDIEVAKQIRRFNGQYSKICLVVDNSNDVWYVHSIKGLTLSNIKNTNNEDLQPSDQWKDNEVEDGNWDYSDEQPIDQSVDALLIF